MKILLAISQLLAISTLISCSQTDMAGGAGNETTNGIQGRILSRSGQPVVAAQVRALPSWYVRDSLLDMENALPSRRWARAITENDGSFALEGLAAGTYQLEVRHGALGKLISVEYREGDTLIENVMADSLAQLRGWVPLPEGTRRAWVQLYGVEAGSFTDSLGNFVLDSLPPGLVRVRAIAAGYSVALGEQSLQLHPGTLHTIDTLPPLEEGGGALETWRSSRILATSRLMVPTPLMNRAGIPLLLRLDAESIDFPGAEPDGADLRITDQSLQPILFEIRQWDAAARKARIWVRLQEPLDQAPQVLILHWGRPGARSASRREQVWNLVPDSNLTQIQTILVDNFDGGSDRNLLGHWWFIRKDEFSTVVQPAIGEPIRSALQSATPRSGQALQVRYTSPPSEFSWVLAGTNLVDGVRDFRGLDSVEFWAKGNGALHLALENNAVTPIRKAWAIIALDSAWRRYRVRPEDFLSPGQGYNIGWNAVRDSVGLLSFFGIYGTEFWVDDVRLHGLSPLEL